MGILLLLSLHALIIRAEEMAQCANSIFGTVLLTP